jgi:elongation factor Ts
VTGEHVVAYLHKTSRTCPPQIGVLLATSGGDEEIAHDVAMHVAAFSPTVLAVPTSPPTSSPTSADRRGDRPRGGQARGRPARIIEGRVNGYFKENVLLEQAFAKDQKKSVANSAASWCCNTGTSEFTA